MTVNVSSAPFVVPFYVDLTGNPAAGGTIETFAAGTTNPLATYADPAGTTPNGTTIYLNSAGMPENNGIYLDTSLVYKFIVFDAAGDQVSVADYIYPLATINGNNVWTGENTFTDAVTAAGFIADGSNTVTGTTSGIITTVGSGDTANGAKNYIGLNVGFNGTNWVTGFNGTGNGGTIILANNGPTEECDIIVIPSTGGTASQVISPGSLPTPQLSIFSGSIVGYGPGAATTFDMTPDSGTFTATLAGVVGTVTGPVQWRKFGMYAMIWSDSVLQGTSNSTVMQLQGLPTEVQPAEAVREGFTGICSGIADNNNTGQQGVFYFPDASVVQFDIYRANTSTGVVSSGNDFTASGSKGWFGALIYPLV